VGSADFPMMLDHLEMPWLLDGLVTLIRPWPEKTWKNLWYQKSKVGLTMIIMVYGSILPPTTSLYQRQKSES
jgi:hypothetical protein